MLDKRFQKYFDQKDKIISKMNVITILNNYFANYYDYQSKFPDEKISILNRFDF